MLKKISCGIIISLVLFYAADIHNTVTADELSDWLQEAEARNPSILAARFRVEQALLKHQELLEFFDPSLYAAVGYANDSRSLPGSSNYAVLNNDSGEMQAGVELPLPPGAYVSVGASSRRLFGSSYDQLYQNLFGINVRIPLLRDQGFAVYGLQRSQALAEYHQVVSLLLAACQDLRHELERAYIGVYESMSAYHVTMEASKRFEALYKEALELTSLKVIPDYEVHQTEMELQIGREDEVKALNVHNLTCRSLARLLGRRNSIKPQHDSDILLKEAEKLGELPVELPVPQALQRRGEILAILNQLEAARVQYSLVEEELKDQLSLNVGTSWQGEHQENPFGIQKRLTDNYWGGEMTLVWRRSLDYHGPKTRSARYQARINELKAELSQVELNVALQLRDAAGNYQSAMQRLKLIKQGVQAARETVSAEQERFRLGEGSSNEVLTAQKNLTIILQRLTISVADLLRARADFHYAAGYDLQP